MRGRFCAVVAKYMALYSLPGSYTDSTRRWFLQPRYQDMWTFACDKSPLYTYEKRYTQKRGPCAARVVTQPSQLCSHCRCLSWGNIVFGCLVLAVPLIPRCCKAPPRAVVSVLWSKGYCLRWFPRTPSHLPPILFVLVLAQLLILFVWLEMQ